MSLDSSVQFRSLITDAPPHPGLWDDPSTSSAHSYAPGYCAGALVSLQKTPKRFMQTGPLADQNVLNTS